MNAPYDEPAPQERPSSERGLSSPSSEGRKWLRRVHVPLPSAPSAEAFAALAAHTEQAGQAWIGWQEGPLRYLAGGALCEWTFPPEEAFRASSRIGSWIRERIVVEPEAAGEVWDLPLLWHGFAFAAGPWQEKVEPPQAPGEDWPGAELRLPAWLLYVRDQRAGLVVHAWVGPEEEPAEVQSRLNERARAILRSSEARSEGEVSSVRGHDSLRLVTDPGQAAAFQARVAAAAAAARELPAEEGAKVVLSRCVSAESEGRFDAPATWLALGQDPGVRAFAWSRGDAGQLVGASPELLVALRGDRVESEALAGTARPASAEWLAQDEKNAREHELVVEAVAGVLEAECGPVTRAPRTLRRLRGLVHLQTSLSTPRRPDHDLLELAEALHPTPALGGTPRAFALPWLAAEERGWFGAPLGFSDQSGGGELLVTIRSALLRGPQAELFAGAGILAASDPATEWQETELKLRAAARALRVRPLSESEAAARKEQA